MAKAVASRKIVDIPHSDKSFQILLALVTVLGGVVIFLLGLTLGGKDSVTKEEVNHLIDQKSQLSVLQQTNLTTGISKLETALESVDKELKILSSNVGKLEISTSGLEKRHDNLERKIEDLKDNVK